MIHLWLGFVMIWCWSCFNGGWARGICAAVTTEVNHAAVQ